jgi:hypothetical protein
MADKKPPVIGLVSVRQAWIDATGFGELFRPMHPERIKGEIYILPVAKYSIAHPAFLEIEWYPRILDGKSARLFIPTNEVISMAIVGAESEHELDKMGFQS